MTVEETISAYLRNIREVAEDALISVRRMQGSESSAVLFRSAEDLCSQAHDIYRLAVRLQTLLIKGCAVRITQDLDNDIRMSIYHYEYVPKFADERWVRVWGRTVSPRIINTLADVQQQIYKLWESIPDGFKRKGCDE